MFLFNKVNAQEIISGSNEYKKFYYPGGSLSSEGLVVNGKPEGYWKNYFENGKIKSEGSRKNFKLDSLWIFYNDSGFITAKYFYKESLREIGRAHV